MTRAADPMRSGLRWHRALAPMAVALCALGGCVGGMPGLGGDASAPGFTLADMEPRDVYRLGQAYETGDGVAPDIQRAAELYAEAARRGYFRANERLGILAARGEIDVDAATTRDRLNAASLRNQTTGSLEFARMILSSDDRSAADDRRAMEILQRYAREGEPAAQIQLARVYADPALGRTDYPEAARLMQAAYDAGNVQAAIELARLHADSTSPLYDPAAARDWAAIAANAGEPRGWLVLGQALSDPDLPGYDPAAAEQAFRMAQASGLPEAPRAYARFLQAQSRYGDAWAIYEQLLAAGEDPEVAYDAARLIDDGGFTDRSRAYALYMTALDAGQSSAVNRLLRLLEDNVGGARTQSAPFAAVAAYADRSRNAEFLGRVGRLYLEGRGGTQDQTKALDYLQRAVDLGNVDAALRAGRLLRDGTPGMAPDLAAAMRYFTIAADAGNGGAWIELGRMQEQAGGLDAAADSYLKALAAGETGGAGQLYRLVRDNPSVAVDMTPVVAGLEEAAEGGDSAAMLALGDIAVEPRFAVAGSGTAIDWYRRAAESGDPVGYRRMGDLAVEAKAGLSPEQALGFYEQALAGGDAAAGLRMASALLEGVPDRAAIERAVALTEPGARQGDSQAQYWYGVALRAQGAYADSIDWLIRAYKAGEERALGQIVTSATEGGARGAVDLDAMFAELTSRGSACERAPWYTLLGDLAARGAVAASEAGDYYVEAMKLGDAAAAAGIGRLNVTGVGLSAPDFATAYVYLTMAKEAGVDGVDGAIANLDRLMTDAERGRIDTIDTGLRAQLGTVCP
ncbi:MAG: hypothetical protein R3F55_11000 [Alphaproteobacteria bacterium]